MDILGFVFGIILLATIASLYRLHLRHGGAAAKGAQARLQAEVRTMRERLAVLERITVEKENSLEREIESLRHGEGAAR